MLNQVSFHAVNNNTISVRLKMIIIFAVTKSVKKAVPNFKAIHERMFEKDLALSDVQSHKSKRADYIKSNKKVTNEGTPKHNFNHFVRHLLN